MKELFSSQFEKIRNWFRPSYIDGLETQASRFVSGISPGTVENLLDTGDGRVRMYHMGPETRVVPGIFAKEIPTGKEHVFIEFRFNSSSYHVVGSVDAASGEFTLARLERYAKGSYRKVSMNQEVVCSVTEILQEIEPDMTNSLVNFQYAGGLS